MCSVFSSSRSPSPSRGGERLRATPLAFWALAATLPAGAAETSPEWRFQLTPYAWLAGLKGDTGTSPDLPAVPIDVSPSDVVDDLEATLMFVFNARRGRHGLYADVFYADIQADEALLPPPIDLSLRVGAETTLFSLAYQYELFRSGQASAKFLAGARYWRVDNRLQFRGGSGGPLAGREFSSGESWTDPLVGIKGSAALGDSRFYLVGGAGVGGFGVGSDSFHEVSGALGYRWTEAIATLIGYRRLEVDYNDDGFIFNVVQQGWQLGLTWSF